MLSLGTVVGCVSGVVDRAGSSMVGMFGNALDEQGTSSLTTAISRSCMKDP